MRGTALLPFMFLEILLSLWTSGCGWQRPQRDACRTNADDAPWIWTVGMEPTERATIEAESQHSVVPVRYDPPAVLEILPGCGQVGEYEFVETTRTVHAEYVRNRAEMCASLPIKASKAAGIFTAGDEWALNYVIHGMRTVSVADLNLKAFRKSCPRATHYVRSMAIGAFKLASIAPWNGEQAVPVRETPDSGVRDGGEGAPGLSDEVVLEEVGDFARCASNDALSNAAACHGIIRLYLAPLK